jgi:ATP-dependent exoDNAse (exonuclease V) alpha subunit
MQTPRTSTPTEVLAGLVERVTFHNEENGFCVLRVKARGQRDLITVLGHAAMIAAGEFVQASGTWVNDRTHGVQFRASFLKAAAPTTIEGIEKYLGSGMIRGIGPIYAKKLVRAFGDTVFDVIQQEPGRLREVTGIGPKRAERIVGGWAEQKVVREIMLFLHSNGVGTSRAVRIYKTYGAEAVQLISQNPYRLARDIRGIGFRTADQIAAKLGIEKTALIRVRAGIAYALTEAMDEGHYDKEVYNGDLGVVSRIDMEESELTVDFDGREVIYGFAELDELVLAYATTIHKSQGSEHPAVVIPLTTQHYVMLQRNLVYTGVTRGKRLVVLVGQRKALAIAVKGGRTKRRWSKLREWLVA